MAQEIFFASLYERNNVWNTVTSRVQITLWIQPRGTFLLCSPPFLPLSASIGKFLGCVTKKFIHSRVSGLRLPPSVSLYRSRNPILESATSDYAATCASFRAHRDIICNATTEMRDWRKPWVGNTYRNAPTYTHPPPPSPRKERDSDVLWCETFCANFSEMISSPIMCLELSGCFSIHHLNTLGSCSLHLSASLKQILITTINNHTVKKDWTN